MKIVKRTVPIIVDRNYFNENYYSKIGRNPTTYFPGDGSLDDSLRHILKEHSNIRELNTAEYLDSEKETLFFPYFDTFFLNKEKRHQVADYIEKIAIEGNEKFLGLQHLKTCQNTYTSQNWKNWFYENRHFIQPRSILLSHALHQRMLSLTAADLTKKELFNYLHDQEAFLKQKFNLPLKLIANKSYLYDYWVDNEDLVRCYNGRIPQEAMTELKKWANSPGNYFSKNQLIGLTYSMHQKIQETKPHVNYV